MPTCTICGANNPDGVRTCRECSAPLQDHSPNEAIINEYSTNTFRQKKSDEFFRKFFGPLYTFAVRFPKSAIMTYLLVMLTIGFLIGRAESSLYKGLYTNVQKKYDELHEEHSALYKEHSDYKRLMEPYEKQQQANAKQIEEDKTIAEALPQESLYDYSSQKSGDIATGKLAKDYDPKGDEPDWIEILSYCEVQLPELMGYDASISSDENYTTIIKTDLRYKLETTRLKLKKDGSYHKATIIIEFEDDSYEYYRVTDFVLNGVTLR